MFMVGSKTSLQLEILRKLNRKICKFYQLRYYKKVEMLLLNASLWVHLSLNRDPLQSRSAVELGPPPEPGTRESHGQGGEVQNGGQAELFL